MILKKFDKLPKEMQNDTVKEYYDILRKKSVALAFKRMFDVFVSLVMLILRSNNYGFQNTYIKKNTRVF